MEWRWNSTNRRRSALWAIDQAVLNLVVKVVRGLEPTLESMAVLAGKVKNDHQKAR